MIYTSDGTGDFNFPLEGTGCTNREQHERDLKRRQQEHLNNINNNINWQPCAHDNCQECVGTGRKQDGSMCIHHLVCHCPKCTPWS